MAGTFVPAFFFVFKNFSSLFLVTIPLKRYIFRIIRFYFRLLLVPAHFLEGGDYRLQTTFQYEKASESSDSH